MPKYPDSIQLYSLQPSHICMGIQGKQTAHLPSFPSLSSIPIQNSAQPS
jgi:hypothetical protein